MKRLHRKRDAAALSSRLIRRPIQRMVWLFLLPTFAAFCIGFLYPFLKGAFLSFCKFKLTSQWTWVGFDNYVKAFSDSSFLHAFWRRLSTMARFMCSFWAKVRARATEPTSGETTTMSSHTEPNFLA